MANQQQHHSPKNNLSMFGVALTKRRILWTLAGLVVVAIAVMIAQNQITIYQQQQRFDSLRPVMQSFETNAKNTLGSSLTDIKEYDSCYHLAQTETPVPGINGILYCGMEIQGATDAFPDIASGDIGAWKTELAIAATAKNALQQSGLKYAEFHRIPNVPGRNGLADYADNYTLNLASGEIGCDLSTSNYDGAASFSIINLHSGQIYFTFNCYQPASKNFFRFIPSPLD